MKLVIIESPYAGAVERNLAYLRRCIMDSLNRGEAPFASHGFYTMPGLLDDADISQRKLGIAAGYAWIKRADLIAFYVDLGWSNGMNASHFRIRMTRLQIPVEIRRIGQAACA